MVSRILILLLVIFSFAGARADDKIFSGPQPGEKLMPFQARGVFGELEGKEFDLVSRADGKPLIVIFVHEVSRPVVGLTRLLMDYASQRSKDGLTSGVIFLSDDATEAENLLKRASHALPTQVPIGISVDGGEGPGAYGLNRQVAMTVVLANENRVRANFALVQPSIQADAERIAKQIVEVLGGGKAPTLADLGVGRDGMPSPDRRQPAGTPDLESLLRSFIQKTNDDAEVEKAAAAIERLVSSDERARARLGEITTNIVKNAKVENYGTVAAQRRLVDWSKKYGKKPAAPQPPPKN